MTASLLSDVTTIWVEDEDGDFYDLNEKHLRHREYVNSLPYIEMAQGLFDDKSIQVAAVLAVTVERTVSKE